MSTPDREGFATVTGERIAALPELHDVGTFLFPVESVETGVVREAILVRTHEHGADGTGVAARLNYCQHFTDVRLDKGGGAPIRNGEVLGTNHGAMFEVDTELCTHGPGEGAYLNRLDVRVVDGQVYLDEPAYAFVDLGPIERAIGDLSATSNVEFQAVGAGTSRRRPSGPVHRVPRFSR